MASLEAYIPMDRRQALARGQDLPDRTTGAALFADVSGFTPLAEALAWELGPRRAAEELIHQLNRVYEALIDQVHQYGGSVIGFVGDAITCWFDGDDGSQAATCSLTMQQVMAPFAQVEVVAGVSAALTIKIGIASGPVCRFRVGDPQIQYFDTLAGDTLRRMSWAEGLAQKGEVVLDGATVAHIQKDVGATVKEWRTHPETDQRFAVVADLIHSVTPTPWSDLPADALTEAQVRLWVLPPVYQRLQAGQGQFLAELRPAVSLFLKFGGLDYDQDKAAGEKLDGYIRWVQQVVDRYAGSLIQLTIGDKGSFLYATFGAPVAHDDDTVRACLAALELRTPSPELDFITSTQIGLARGQARTGAYGSSARRSYGVISKDVVLACRLMGVAPPGEIRCDYNVYRQADGPIGFEGLPPVRVKGRAGLVRVYRPTGKRAREEAKGRDSKGAIVGRNAEMARLEAALVAVEGREGWALIIEGEAGIGKSRLVAELTRITKERGLIWLLGAGQSIEQQTPYRAWRDVFSSYFDIDDVTDIAERQQRVRATVEQLMPDQIQRLPLLNDVLNLGLPDTDLTATLDPELRQQSLVSFLLELLRAWTKERPLILVLEDAHWLDSLSWELTAQATRALVASDDPLLLVLVSRPLDEHSVGAQHLTALRVLEKTETLSLDTLSPEETVALVTSRLGLPEGSLPDPVAELVRERAGGNPFFAEELVFALRDQDIIVVESVPQTLEVSGTFKALNRCIISGDLAQAAQALPDTVQGLVLARIDRLSLERQLTLKVASVIGRTFAYTALSRVLQQHATIADATLKSHLDALDSLDLTPLDTVEPLTYIFKHIITQEVAYQTLLFAQRRQLHQAVAEWYEGTFEGEQLTPYYPLLVHHYRHAENAERERHYAKLAGEQAAVQFANAEAVRYFSRALELTPEVDWAERYGLRLARERVYDLQGAREAQKEDLVALEALAETSDPERQAEVAYRWGQYHEAVGEYAQAQAAVERAQAAARGRGDTVGEVRCLTQLGLIARRQGEFDRAKAYYNQALVLLEDQETSSDEKALAQSRALYLLGVIHRQQGDFEQALGCDERALELHRASGNRKGEAEVLSDMGTTAYYQRRFTEALIYHRQALQIWRTIGDRAGEGRGLYSLVGASWEMGDYELAQECLSEALAIHQVTGDRWEQVNVWNGLGIQHQELGDLPQARNCLERGLQLAQEIGDEEGQAYLLLNLGLVARDQGNLEAAGRMLTDGLALVQALDSEFQESNFFSYVSTVSLRAGRFEEAVEQAERALTLRRRLDLRLNTADDLATLAAAYLGDGNTGRAQAYAQEALAILEECGGVGPEFPQRDYFICYRVLTAAGQVERAGAALQSAYDLVMARADKITDPDLRGSFLENVAAHREIVSEWQAMNSE